MRYMLSLACVLVLLPALTAAAPNPADESANRAACTGTCSTCPGKAQAVSGLAGMSSLTISLKQALAEDAAIELRGKIEGIKGVASCVVDGANSLAWVAFDGKKVKPADLVRAFEKQGSAIEAASAPLAPLPPLPEGYNRAVVYFLAPDDADTGESLAQMLKEIGGVVSHRREPFFNMLLLDYDPAKVELGEVKLALLGMGFASGLPGEEMTQPE